MRYLAALLILIPSFALADCPPVSYLTQGTPAACTGYLFTPAKELEVRTKVEKFDTMTQIVQQQDELINNLKNQVSNTNDQLASAKSSDTMDKIIYFVIGVAVMGAASYIAHR